MLKQSQIKTCLKCGQENPSWVEFTLEHHSCPPVLPFPSLFSLLPAMLCFALTPISHEFSISVSDSHKIFHFNTTLMFTKRNDLAWECVWAGTAPFRETEALQVTPRSARCWEELRSFQFPWLKHKEISPCGAVDFWGVFIGSLFVQHSS